MTKTYLFSVGSYFNASLDDGQHDEKEDALVRAICNVFDSESESEDSVDTPGQGQPAKRRRNLQVVGSMLLSRPS
jgi:hypothetical protein